MPECTCHDSPRDEDAQYVDCTSNAPECCAEYTTEARSVISECELSKDHSGRHFALISWE